MRRGGHYGFVDMIEGVEPLIEWGTVERSEPAFALFGFKVVFHARMDLQALCRGVF